jgi:hypothetical protein
MARIKSYSPEPVCNVHLRIRDQRLKTCHDSTNPAPLINRSTIPIACIEGVRYELILATQFGINGHNRSTPNTSDNGGGALLSAAMPWSRFSIRRPEAPNLDLH